MSRVGRVVGIEGFAGAEAPVVDLDELVLGLIIGKSKAEAQQEILAKAPENPKLQEEIVPLVLNQTLFDTLIGEGKIAFDESGIIQSA